MRGFGIRLALAFGITCLGLTAIDCGGKVETDKQEMATNATQQSLTFDSFTKSNISGEFTDGTDKLNFVSTLSDNVRNLEFIVNGVVIGKMNHNANGDGLFVADSNGTAKSRALITGLLENIKKLDEQTVLAIYDEDLNSTALGQLMNSAEHFTTATLNRTIHHQRPRPIKADPNAVTVKSWGDDGITYLWQCSRKSSNRVAPAYWTDYRGGMSATVACGISATACQGRCGAGCPACNSWYCPNRYYTQDCLEHDVCLDNNPGDGSLDPYAANCGDEWGNAFWDTVNGSSNDSRW